MALDEITQLYNETVDSAFLKISSGRFHIEDIFI